MSATRTPLLRRPAWWWLPAAFTAASLVLALSALKTPQQESAMLVAAILVALPWSLLLLALSIVPGFADQAALVVCVGLLLNVAVVWIAAALLHSRLRTRLGAGVLPVAPH